MEQYGCGPVQFIETNDALYEHHLIFDNVREPKMTGARQRFEAAARSGRDILSQRWVRTEETYQRQNLWRYLKSPEGESGQVAWELMRLAWSSAATLAVAPLQDVLNVRPEARMNVPGRGEGNWACRCTEKMLSVADFDTLRALARASNRLGVLQPLVTGEMMEAAS